MKQESISFGSKNKETGEIERGGEVTYNMPETVDEAVKLWGEEVVLTKCLASVVVDIQGQARKHDDVEAAQAALNDWTPSPARTRGSGGSSKSAMLKKLKDLSPDELAAILEAANVS